MEIINIINNECFWHLDDGVPLRTVPVLVPNPITLNHSKPTKKDFTRDLCALLKKFDKNSNALYGIEIKTNGSSRSGRIPLIRYTKNSKSIWKVAKNLKSVEKAVIDLEELLYYLSKSRVDVGLPLPKKVILCTFDESEYCSNSDHSLFVKNLINNSGVIWISSIFLYQKLLKYSYLDIDSLLLKDGEIFTLENIQ